jgi:hypothetical protein
VLDEHVEFLERIAVEQELDALARRQFALGVLGVDASLAAAKPRLLTALVEAGENVFQDAAPDFMAKIRLFLARAPRARNRRRHRNKG